MAREGREKEKPMHRMLVVLLLFTPVHATAQGSHKNHMTHGGGQRTHTAKPSAAMPIQAGQAAFAAVQEIVEILEADPGTDWSKVDIRALRQHLVDMNNVTLNAAVKSEAIGNGAKYTLTGVGPVRESIRRMVTAHAATMNGVDGWTFAAAEIEDGTALTVHVPTKDAQKIRGLGFLGVMTHGMHHQQHHLMIARGSSPHH
jgi:hypothetical protein